MSEIKRTIKLNAAPKTVYEWLTQADHMQNWFADTVKSTDDGLSFKWNMQDGGQVGFDVVIVTDDAPKTFAYKASDGSEITTRFDIAHDGEHTIVVMVESGFSEDEAGTALRDEHAGGWDWFLSRLQNLESVPSDS